MRRIVAIGSLAGLHARTAALVASVAAAQPVPVTIRVGDRPAVPANSILALLTLGAVHRAEVTLEAHGPGAPAALDELSELLARDLDG